MPEAFEESFALLLNRVFVVTERLSVVDLFRADSRYVYGALVDCDRTRGVENYVYVVVRRDVDSRLLVEDFDFGRKLGNAGVGSEAQIRNREDIAVGYGRFFVYGIGLVIQNLAVVVALVVLERDRYRALFKGNLPAENSVNIGIGNVVAVLVGDGYSVRVGFDQRGRFCKVFINKFRALYRVAVAEVSSDCGQFAVGYYALFHSDVNGFGHYRERVRRAVTVVAEHAFRIRSYKVFAGAGGLFRRPHVRARNRKFVAHRVENGVRAVS